MLCHSSLLRQDPPTRKTAWSLSTTPVMTDAVPRREEYRMHDLPSFRAPHSNRESFDGPASTDTASSIERPGSSGTSSYSVAAATTTPSTNGPSRTPSPAASVASSGSSTTSTSTASTKSRSCIGKVWHWTVGKIDRSIVLGGVIIAGFVAYPSFRSWLVTQWTARKAYIEYCQTHNVRWSARHGSED